tara:strand:- start:528 stop:1004 length:477 start_codon:yes stop_codon:yes gene_type:complete
MMSPISRRRRVQLVIRDLSQFGTPVSSETAVPASDISINDIGNTPESEEGASAVAVATDKDYAVEAVPVQPVQPASNESHPTPYGFLAEIQESRVSFSSTTVPISPAIWPSPVNPKDCSACIYDPLQVSNSAQPELQRKPNISTVYSSFTNFLNYFGM